MVHAVPAPSGAYGLFPRQFDLRAEMFTLGAVKEVVTVVNGGESQSPRFRRIAFLVTFNVRNGLQFVKMGKDARHRRKLIPRVTIYFFRILRYFLVDHSLFYETLGQRRTEDEDSTDFHYSLKHFLP